MSETPPRTTGGKLSTRPKRRIGHPAYTSTMVMTPEQREAHLRVRLATLETEIAELSRQRLVRPGLQDARLHTRQSDLESEAKLVRVALGHSAETTPRAQWVWWVVLTAAAGVVLALAVAID